MTTGPVDKVRAGLLLRTCMEILRDGRRMASRDVVDEVARRVDLTPYERQPVKSGAPRWNVDLGIYTGYADSAGWLVKQGSQWWITKAGLAALERFTSPETLVAEVRRRYREIYNSRKEARKKFGGKLGVIAAALDLLPKGSWTSHEDLAELIDGTPDEIAHLLADGDALPTSHRVLTSDGEVPPAGRLNLAFRRAPTFAHGWKRRVWSSAVGGQAPSSGCQPNSSEGC